MFHKTWYALCFTIHLYILYICFGKLISRDRNGDRKKMKNYFKKYILFTLFLTHSLGSWAYLQSPANGSYGKGIMQIISDKGSSAEIEYYGKNGWEVIGKSSLPFDTRSLVNGTHSFRDCYSYVTNDSVCVDNRVWVPKVVWVNNPVWISNPVQVCEDILKYKPVWVEDIGPCNEYDDEGFCIDYVDNGYWSNQSYYEHSCSTVNQGYWKDVGSSKDQGRWDAQKTCNSNDKTKRTCDPQINMNINNINVGKPPAPSLSVTCLNNKTNSAGNVEIVKCTASIQAVSNINWFARVGTSGDFSPLNTCSFNSDRTILECANVPAGTYQVKAVGDSITGKVESPIATIQATTVSISCTPKNAKAGTTGVDITCNAGTKGTPVDGAVVVSGYWTASYVDSKTKQIVSVPKFCENLSICKIPSVPAGTYDVQARTIDKYGNEVISNLEKVIVAP